MILLKKKNFLETEETATGEKIEIKDKKIDVKSLTIDGKCKQQIRSGKNLLKNGLTSQIQNGVDIKIENDKSITLNGKTTSNLILILQDYNNSDLIRINNYTLSLNQQLIGDNSFIRLEFSEDKSTSFKYINIYAGQSIQNSFNLEKNSYMKCSLFISAGTLLTNFNIKAQVEKGTVNTEYEQYGVMPSPNYPSEIKTISDEINIKVSGKNIIFSVEKRGNILYFNNTSSYTDYIFEAGTYTISFETQNSNYGIFYQTEDGTSGNFGKVLFKTFTFNQKFNIWVYSTDLTFFPFNNIQLEKSEILTEYEAYQEDISTINLADNELCKVGEVKDELIIEKEKTKILKKIGKVVLNGSETMTRYETEQGTLFRIENVIVNALYNVDTNGNAMSSHYIKSNYGHRTNNTFYIYENTKLDVLDNRFSTVDEFKTWLSTHNVTIYYELATPEEKDLEDFNISLISSKTIYISNNDDTNMRLKYISFTPQIFNFETILVSGYRINEQPNLIAKKQFTNGKRKKIITPYIDVTINIDLGCFEGNNLAKCLENLTDGEYQYYSLKDKQMKSANFIVTLPELQVDNSACEVFVGDFTATLEKSSDVE